MENNEIEEFLVAYRKGVTADFIQPKIDGSWGALWTFPPCDPAAAERVGRKTVRMGATEVRWLRRARLRNSTGTLEDVLVILSLPYEQQDVISLSSGMKFKINRLLVDQSHIALSSAFASGLIGVL